ncbi:MAG: RNA-binding protein [Bacillota bacterium]
MGRERFMATAGGEEKLLMARAADMARSVLDSHRPQYTDFYDPYHAGLIVSALRRADGLKYRADGGYPGAERQRVVICPDYMDPLEVPGGISFLSVTGRYYGSRPGHRDYLGALLGMGLKREKIGDILVHEDGAHLIVAEEIAPVILAGLSGVGRYTVRVEEIAAADLRLPVERVKAVKTTVSSLRLDAVAAAGFGVSRSKMADFITAERVYLNWQVKNSPSRAVKPGDVITIRGRGRVEVEGVEGVSRGGRIFIQLRRYY